MPILRYYTRTKDISKQKLIHTLERETRQQPQRNCSSFKGRRVTYQDNVYEVHHLFGESSFLSQWLGLHDILLVAEITEESSRSQ